MLQDAGIKLSSVASQAYSKSARAILDALVAGERDPRILATLVKGRLRSKQAQLYEALGHRFRVEHHGVLVRRLLANLDALDAAIAELDTEIAGRLEPHQVMLELLCTIPGVGPKTVQVLVAEIGLDMSIFPTSGHLASWAGVCPGNKASGGKRRSGRTRPGSRWLKQALTEAAWGAARARGPIWPPTMPRSAAGPGATRRSARPGTTSSSPTGTSPATACPSGNLGPTGSAAAIHPNTGPAA
ncbi:transposase [Streptomyces sp. NPDC054775]